MRLKHLRTKNVGGLHDCDIALEDHRLLAFAGANGTGKSKLLACLLTPWTRAIPASRDADVAASVDVTVRFNEAERHAIAQYDRESGWNQGSPPVEYTLHFSNHLMSGATINSTPEYVAGRELFTNPVFLQRNPSCNLIYLPAERRLLPPNNPALDLSQLADEVGVQRLADARSSVQSYGRLDDQEFENYAKALCVAGSLPSESGVHESGDAQSNRWIAFKQAVDNLLTPKVLRPLTRENPSELYIGLPDGGKHRIHDLSSGERQALIILSRVFRAGEGQSLIAIDEPDAYLHPSLSSRLLTSLYAGLEEGGRMLVATHSPSILDAISPEAIIRLSHDRPASKVESEGDRLTLYREAGFRASALTQADLLVVVEGDLDSLVLPQLIPGLGSAAIRVAGGRKQVFQAVETLNRYELPILGVVDADVAAEEPPEAIRSLITVWPAADIEAVLLQDDATIAELVAGHLVKDEMRDPETLRAKVNEHLLQFRDQAIAEIAQRELRDKISITWPSPRGDDGIARLRGLAGNTPQLTPEMVEAAIATAERVWDARLPFPWSLVRGKWMAPALNREISNFKSWEALVSALLARQPRNAAIDALAETVRTAGAASKS